jgi:putative hemolysin
MGTTTAITEPRRLTTAQRAVVRRLEGGAAPEHQIQDALGAGMGRERRPPMRSVARVLNNLFAAGVVERGTTWGAWRLTRAGYALAAALRSTAGVLALLVLASACAPGATLAGRAACDQVDRDGTCTEGPAFAVPEADCADAGGAYLLGARCARDGRAPGACVLPDGRVIYAYRPATEQDVRALCVAAGARFDPAGGP